MHSSASVATPLRTKAAVVTVVVLTTLALGHALPKEAVAQFQAEPPYTVTVVNSPSDGGKVAGQPWAYTNEDKIDCGTDCSAVVTNEPTGCDELGCADSWSIGLHAIPAEGYAFDRWEECRNDGGGGAYEDWCYLNSSGDVTVTAHWREAECNDNIDNDGDGQNNSDDPDCQSISDDKEAYVPPPDTTPPDITVTPASIGRTNDPTPTVEFSSSEAGVTYTCLVRNMNYWSTLGGQFMNCTSPYTSPPLTEGPWRIEITAYDAVGNRTVEHRPLTVDTTAPDTWISSDPPDRSRSARFEFSASESGSTFQCSLDGATPSPCTSPKGYSDPSHGVHTFEVAAIDEAGNIDPTPARQTWEVDADAPAVTAISPASGESGVSPQTDVFATFSEAMDRATITNTSFKLFPNGTIAPVSAKVTYDASLKRAKLSPQGSLRRGAQYTATVTTNVKDLIGNPLASAKTWSFTVRP